MNKPSLRSTLLALTMGLLTTLTAPPASGATFTFTPPNATTAQNWSAATSWTKDSGISAYPNSANDNVIVTGSSTSYNLTADTDSVEIGNLTYQAYASGATQRIYANTGTRTLKIGTLTQDGDYTVVFGNGSATSFLSVEVGNFNLNSGISEIGSSLPARLDGFKVTGTSTIGASLYFDGVNNGNTIDLGVLNVTSTGNVYLGARGNTGGKITVSSLIGSGNIQVAGTSYNNGTSGTLDINSTNASPATFTGLLRDTTTVGNPSSLTLIKRGSGTQILSRTGSGSGNSVNPYSGGTLIKEGILAIQNDYNIVSALGTGAVTVENGGTLAAKVGGAIRLGEGNSITVKAGGQLAPGALNDGFAQLRLNGAANGTAAVLSMEEGAGFTFNLGTGNQSDSIAFLSYAGASDFLSNGAVIHANQIQTGVFTLFSFYRAETIKVADLISSGLSSGALTFEQIDGYIGTLHYDAVGYGGVGTITLEINAIPEPSAIASVSLASILILWHLKNKRTIAS